MLLNLYTRFILLNMV